MSLLLIKNDRKSCNSSIFIQHCQIWKIDNEYDVLLNFFERRTCSVHNTMKTLYELEIKDLYQKYILTTCQQAGNIYSVYIAPASKDPSFIIFKRDPRIEKDWGKYTHPGSISSRRFPSLWSDKKYMVSRMLDQNLIYLSGIN